MKKTITLALLMLTSIAGHTENVYKLHDGKEISRELIDIPASILAVYLVSVFLINVIKGILNYRLKSKMIDKGLSNDIIKQFLQPDQYESKNQTIKSFLILLGIGVGVTTAGFFQPLGIHSAAILVFSLALSFLAYYYYIKQAEK